jgi:hypothetical protein
MEIEIQNVAITTPNAAPVPTMRRALWHLKERLP